MAKIKSALELALEKTEGMSFDRDKLKQKDLKEQGQKLASAIIGGTEKEGREKLKAFDTGDMPFIKEGFGETLLANIRLPLYINSDTKLDVLNECFSMVSDREDIYGLIFEQLKQLFQKYIEDMEHLAEALKEQYLPILKQKQQQVRQQTGRNIPLDPERDPEFMDILSRNRKALEEQYSEVIVQAKAELKKIL